MAKNHMPDVAKMLGVELEEEFKVENYASYIFRIGENSLEMHHECNEDWEETPIIGRILNGELAIFKLPWKPKIGQIWYFPNITFKKVFWDLWGEDTRSYALCLLGMCYRTREEAEAHLAEDYKKLTGKELEE